MIDRPHQVPQDELPAAPRRPWAAPQLSELPRLVQLTLLSGGAIGGIGGSGGISFP